MKTVHVNASVPYDILIGAHLYDQLGTLLRQVLKGNKILIVSDSNVAPLYLEQVKTTLEREGFEVYSHVFPAGEPSKNLETYASLVRHLGELQFSRTDTLAALGGGVTGDLTGFASATYLRGIAYVQLPTSLLAAVDSSVGGKTAIDLPIGKNLIGAFHQPKLVVTDTETLHTLPQSYFEDGSAEILKYGMLFDRDFLLNLTTLLKTNPEEVIYQSCMFKKMAVEKDEFDMGYRQLLNLGHTVGHAVECASDYQISHGRAIAIGMRIMMNYSAKEGLASEEDLKQLDFILKELHLPLHTDYSARELAEICLNDKKRRGENITLVLPYGIGRCKLTDLPIESLEEVIEKGLKP